MAATLHPQIQQALQALAKAGLPPIESMTPADARLQMEAMVRARGGEPAAISRTEERTVPGRGGDIPVRIYWPNQADAGADGPLGALLYFHGGGHVLGTLDTHDRIARNLCAGAGALVVAVDYRMGPENRFPAAVEDSWSALEWLMRTAPELGADPGRIAVAGDSAGANLAAVVCLMARDAGGPPIRLQALVYPVADYALADDSYTTYAQGYGVVTREAMRWFRQHYLRDAADAADWRASPVRAASHAGVAPAVIVAAECDVLHDEGVRYAEALRAAGVPTEYVRYAGMIHGFFGMAPDVDDAVAAQRVVTAAIRRALAGPAPAQQAARGPGIGD
jgi:acetyl esterase